MIEHNLSTGYDLYNPFGDNQWVIDLKNGLSFHGTLKEIVLYMTEVQGFDKSIVINATEEMVNKGHNAIHFGCLQTVIYTFNKEIDLNQAS